MALNTNVSPDHFPKLIQLRGLPTIGRLQFRILLKLYDAGSQDTKQIFKSLPYSPENGASEIGWKTSITSLVRRDYVIGTRDYSMYQITPRGIKMLREILRRCLPKDERYQKNLCCRCRERPRHRMPSGLRSWCLECIRSIERRSAQMGRRRMKPEYPCSRCKDPDRSRYISKTGIVSQYCESCKKAVTREKRESMHKRMRERIEGGEAVLCKCGQPVYITPNYISKRCKGCEWTHTSKGRSRRAPKKR